MHDVNNELQNRCMDLRAEGYPVDHLQKYGSMLPQVVVQQRDSAFAEFHKLADKVPPHENVDVGALILECIADSETRADFRARLYEEAIRRAEWCVSLATTAGEEYPGSRHLERLREKQKSMQK